LRDTAKTLEQLEKSTGRSITAYFGVRTAGQRNHGQRH
jgi:hypothetical protein